MPELPTPLVQELNVSAAYCSGEIMHHALDRLATETVPLYPLSPYPPFLAIQRVEPSASNAEFSLLSATCIRYRVDFSLFHAIWLK